MADESAIPAGIEGIDTSRPSIARLYDYLLGGTQNFPIDREIAAKTLQVVPQLRDVARDNRAILIRGVRHMAEAGIRQFLDLGSGLPTEQNTHQVVQRVAPDARVVYVDIDPLVREHALALLGDSLHGDTAHTTLVSGDMRRPEEILAHPEVRSLIDFSEPVGLMMLGVIHHLRDHEDPDGITTAYREALVPGSLFFLTHFCASYPDALELEKTMLATLGTGRFRTEEEIAAYFSGLEMLPPGLVALPEWRPDAPLSGALSDSQRLMMGGIGRKT
ncbi:MAG: SAM-dependent methyltransferase [Streptosporangiales bacterium]|nr:SAM-dependent methyltransferase [Streptosporangiales bacterium]